MTLTNETILAPLLRSMTVLEFIARHLDPLTFDAMMIAVGTPEQALRDVLGVAASPTGAADSTLGQLLTASRHTLAAFDGIRTALSQGDDLYAIYRALRELPRAQAVLYPLAAQVPGVNGFFLDASLRGDAEALARGARTPRDGETGLMHFDNERGSRGGFSLYVPENYTPEHALPLVMALHGGSGNGRDFLWSWLRDARSFGAIVAAPTAVGPTWALMGEDTDTPNLHRILDFVEQRWYVDSTRLLLTGMSDGGTFCYVSGLEARSRFTHLAPVSATFHPLMATMADVERVKGLPIHIAHGARDWMFPVEVARRAGEALAATGGEITYSEIDDLSHCYPREINPTLLTWLRNTSR